MSEIQKCCIKCGYAISGEIKDCPECGARQKTSKPRQTVSNTAAFLIVGISIAFLDVLTLVIA